MSLVTSGYKSSSKTIQTTVQPYSSLSVTTTSKITTETSIAQEAVLKDIYNIISVAQNYYNIGEYMQAVDSFKKAQFAIKDLKLSAARINELINGFVANYNKAKDIVDTAKMHFLNAMMLEYKKNFDEAKKELQAALIIYPKYKDASDSLVTLNQTITDTLQPILLQPIEINTPFMVLENHPTEFSKANVSFEKIYYLKDYFSDKYGFRPFPWGKEIFAGKPEFLCDNTISRSGKWSFQIIGKDKLDDGALAVPNLRFKPKVIPGRFYSLSFWINYNVYDGHGVRLIQQFFRNGDFKNKKKGKRIYPSYACYGPWITGTSDGKWVKYNLIAKAPDDAILGDPVIALLGTGKVNIDDVFFGEIKFLSF